MIRDSALPHPRRRACSDGPPFHRAKLDRQLALLAASRRHMKVLADLPTIKMEFDSFDDLWMGSCHHRPPGLAPGGHVVTAKIGAFVDHATRYPTADRDCIDETLDTCFDPNDLSSVVIFKDDRRIQEAFPRPVHAPPQKPPVPEQVAASVNNLALLREDYDRQLLKHARPLAYAKLELEPGFDEDAFARVIASLAGLKLRPGDRREIGASWKSVGPLPESLARIGVEHTVRLHGRNRHVWSHLTAVRTPVLANWRGPTHKETR